MGLPARLPVNFPVVALHILAEQLGTIAASDGLTGSERKVWTDLVVIGDPGLVKLPPS